MQSCEALFALLIACDGVKPTKQVPGVVACLVRSEGCLSIFSLVEGRVVDVDTDSERAAYGKVFDITIVVLY